MTNLILIDGPPGVGKTTLGLALAKNLPSHRLLLEMDLQHPLHPVPVSDDFADFADAARMPLDELGGLLIEKWEAFHVELGATGFILESYPYQSHLRVLWQMNAPDSYLSEWQDALFESIGPANPLLVTIDFTDDWNQLKQIYESRGPEWMGFLDQFVAETPKAKALGLSGRAGTMEFLKRYQGALKSWCANWPFSKIELEAWKLAPETQAAQILSRF